MSSEDTPDSIPIGFNLRHTLRGHDDVIFQVAWSPDGRMLASGSQDGTVRLWDSTTGLLLRSLAQYSGSIYSLAWSPDGRILASGNDEDGPIFLWDTRSEQTPSTLTGHLDSTYSLAWSPDGRTLASGSLDDTVRLWNIKTGQTRRTLTGHSASIRSIAWSPDGQTLASGSSDRTVRLWDIRTGQPHSTLTGDSDVHSIAWSPDGLILASGNNSGTINLWDTKTGQLRSVLEGHTDVIWSIAIYFNDHLLASKSRDGTVRLWRYDTGENIATLHEPTSGYRTSSIAFNPKTLVLATLGEEDLAIRIWDLDFNLIIGARSAARSVSYTNAKVVLVGETGVGKTGLGVRLAEGVWRPTAGSTHGMNVWTLYSEMEREVMLWDFAGQEEYRLVHQLFLNETNVALMLYDPTKSNDTFEGIGYWEKALCNAVQGDVQKILVAARIDVGGVRMTAGDIEAFCTAHGYLSHFATSAETNEGCDELRTAIMAAIPWEQLPRTNSPEVFKRIKDFLTAVRQGNRVLIRERDLLAEFKAQADKDTSTEEDEFRTVIGHIETAGLIKRLSFGDFVLLKPELLNSYASSIVDAARRHPNGLGAVRKADVLNGRIKLKEENELNQSDKIFLLYATVELFLRLGLALEQDGNLVFPSKFNNRMPPLEADPVIDVEFILEGPVENLYTTLVVKLYYGGIFRLKKLWKNAAEFFNARECICGFQLYSEGDGRGTIRVFYAETVSDDDKALFLKFIADHFKEKQVAVARQRIYRCPHCRESVRDLNAVNKALARELKEMPCLYCDKKLPLFDALEVLYRDNYKFLTQIAFMESRAEESMERGGGFVSASAELRTEDFKSWAGGASIATVAVVFTDVLNSTWLNVKLGDEHWREIREAHFARAKGLIKRGHGYLIKTIGDSVMVAFHNAVDALDFAIALCDQTGHESVKIRAGINIGPVEITSDDAFGQQVSMAARVEAKAVHGGIWVSAQVKEDIEIVRAERHKRLKWEEHPDEELKGFPQKCTLWSVE
jgi:small GTP-binding protein